MSGRRWMGVRERTLDPSRRSLTASEAASMVGVSLPTIRLWADAGRIPCHRTAGGHRRFEVEELLEWMQMHGAPAPRAIKSVPVFPTITPCPAMARYLLAHTDAVAERLRAHADTAIALPVPMPSPGRAHGDSARYLRMVGRALDTGRLGDIDQRAEATGVRGSLRGGAVALLMADRRLSTATLAQADLGVSGGHVTDPMALATTHTVVEHCTAALLRGLLAVDGKIPATD